MKRNVFFIAGLPRCRSAWFSNVLTWGDSFCWHDGFYGLDSIEEFPDKRTKLAHRNIGNSDPANVLFWERLHEWFPDARWVVIDRNFEETYRSVNKILPVERAALWAFADKLGELKAKLNPKVIAFDSITPDVVMDVANYVGVNAGSRTRIESLCRMNIQIEPQFLREALRELTGAEFKCSNHD